MQPRDDADHRPHLTPFRAEKQGLDAQVLTNLRVR